MKKVALILSAAALATFGLAGNALALHDGGVARCEACHTMHNSVGNAAVKTTASGLAQFQAGPYLLKGSDQSSACLNCHEGATRSSYKVSTSGVNDTSTPPVQLTPGGDFAWLKKNWSWDNRGTKTSAGSAHGHNIVAADFGYGVETRMAGNVAPGGNYPVAQFYCSSCHDPHGRYRIDSTGAVATTGAPITESGSYGAAPAAGTAVGAYRLLGGVGYQPKSITDGTLAFAQTVPTAVAPSSYNASEATAQTRVSYGAGMGEWCSNCHGGLLMNGYVSGNSMQRHPSGNEADLTAAIIGNYNSYVWTGKTDGAYATAFNSLVPFEVGSTDRAALAALTTATTGADTGANVMCLSCHRAHASGFDSMTRWDTKETFITEGGAYLTYAVGTNPRTVADLQAAYYDRPATSFSAYQRSLCNKCHVKD